MRDQREPSSERLWGIRLPLELEELYSERTQNKMSQDETRFFRIIGKIVAALALMIIAYMAFPWKRIYVEPGFVGVYMDKPYFFGKKGVRLDEVMQPGSDWAWKTTELIPVISVPYKQDSRIDDFATKDNYLVDFDSVVSLRISDQAKIVADWRLTFWTETLRAEYNSIVRRAVSGYSLYELMSDTEKLKSLDNEITTNMKAHIKSIGIPIVVENVALGRAKPSNEVMAQITETARRIEEKATFTRMADAQTSRKEAEKNRATADKAYALEMGLSAAQFTMLRMVEMQTNACMKAASCVIGIDRVTPAGK